MEAVREWMKEFLVIYLILTILMHLAAAEPYKKYLRFFSGIILLAVLASPLLRFSGNGNKGGLQAYYDRFWQELDRAQQETMDFESVQNSRFAERYEMAAEKGILKRVQEMGIPLGRVRVQISSDYEIESISAWMQTQNQQDSANQEKTANQKSSANQEKPANQESSVNQKDFTRQQEAWGRQGQADKDRLAQYLCEAYGLDEGQVFIYGL